MTKGQRIIHIDMEPTYIDGVPHYTVTQMSFAARLTASRIHQLISDGNKRRKLRCTRLGGKPFIPVSELTDFFGTESGAGHAV